MTTHARLRTVPALAVGFTLALAACGGTSLPSSTPVPAAATPEVTPEATADPTPAPTPDPAMGVGRRAAYTAAICPVFLDILAIDPRLAALRAEGRTDGDVAAQADEIVSVGSELRTVMNELHRVPDWAPGRLLRSELTGALHEIRSALLRVAREPDHPNAAAQLADVPYIARPMLDNGMQQAANAGLSCDEF